MSTLASTTLPSDVQHRAVQLLQALIRCDTSNPPGREAQAAAVIEDYVRGSGLECERVAKDPDRPNLIVRLRGRGTGPSLGFLGHLDVIGVDRADWTIDPFAGVLRDDHVWGRGTVDMKSQVAATTVALTELARAGFEPNGDLMLILTVDEEDGDLGVGAPHLVEARPDLCPDYIVGEGSGERFDVPTGPFYMLDCGVKGSASAKLHVHGVTGDASLPDIGRNAIQELGRLLQRLREWESPVQVHPALHDLLDALAPDVEGREAQVAVVRAMHPGLDQIVGALTGTVFHPVILDAPGPDNVVPRRATALISAIVMPDVTTEQLEAELREALGEGNYELEMEDPNGGLISKPDTPLHDAIASFIAEHDPDARVLPGLGYGLSDCQVMRESYGSIAYGFIPFRHADPMLNLQTKHGVDERVHVDDLAFQVAAATHIAREMGRLER